MSSQLTSARLAAPAIASMFASSLLRSVASNRFVACESEQFIPAKYNAKSTLEVEIKANSNTANFELKSAD